MHYGNDIYAQTKFNPDTEKKHKTFTSLGYKRKCASASLLCLLLLLLLLAVVVRLSKVTSSNIFMMSVGVFSRCPGIINSINVAFLIYLYFKKKLI